MARRTDRAEVTSQPARSSNDADSAATLTRVRATRYRRDACLVVMVQVWARTENGDSVTGAAEINLGLLTRVGPDRGWWDSFERVLEGLEELGIGDVVHSGGSAKEVHDLVVELARRKTARSGAASMPQVVGSARRRTNLDRIKEAKFKVFIYAWRVLTRHGVRALRNVEPLAHSTLALEAALVRVAAAAATPSTKPRLPRHSGLLSPVAKDLTEPAALEAAYERMVNHIEHVSAFPRLPSTDFHGRTPNEFDALEYLEPLGTEGARGYMLESAALSLGLDSKRFTNGTIQVSDAKATPILFRWSRPSSSSAAALAICTHKQTGRIVLERAGMPVPRGRSFLWNDQERAIEYANRIGYPVVAKPTHGLRGIGVFANIQDEKELRRAMDLMGETRFRGEEFLIEQHVPGRRFRIVVVADQVVGAVMCEPASVIGDGTRTVAELIIDKNLVRSFNPHLWSRPIVLNDYAKYRLEKTGFGLHDVPPSGTHIVLSTSDSFSQGGDSIDVLDELHPSIKEMCVKAVAAIPGLAFCGIDLLINDHTSELEGQGAGICEMNPHAAIGNCEYPLYGKPRKVALALMRHSALKRELQVRATAAEQLAVKVTVRGKVTAVGYRAWAKSRAEATGVVGIVRNLDDQTVEMVLVGDRIPVSALVTHAMKGTKKARPQWVSTEHVKVPDTSSFEIITSGDQGSDDDH